MPDDLKRPLPPNRTYAQVQRHFEVEKALAERLMKASRAERQQLYRTMYNELFAQVPDHPRLTAREDERATQTANRSKYRLLNHYLTPATTLLEFAPGDCRFAMDVCQRVHFVYGVDISDQKGEVAQVPDNFELVIYDGYHLDLPDGSIDLVFSDQLIEHFHPEDTLAHFQLVHRLLRPGGVYVFRTPHFYVGPSDVSKYFSDTPQGFHLREWRYSELDDVLDKAGFRGWHGIWNKRRLAMAMPRTVLMVIESLLQHTSRHAQRKVGRVLLPNLTVCARK